MFLLQARHLSIMATTPRLAQAASHVHSEASPHTIHAEPLPSDGNCWTGVGRQWGRGPLIPDSPH